MSTGGRILGLGEISANGISIGLGRGTAVPSWRPSSDSRPTILVGVSKGGAFTQHVVETMCWLNERPILFGAPHDIRALESNRQSRVLAEQAYSWSKGKALYAAGVQFPGVKWPHLSPWPGQQLLHLFRPLAWPTAARRCMLADQVCPDLRAKGMLLPRQANIP
jgi:malate dehydrogenase (oxaloacetate-decarboxylating)(NADP+)